MVGKIHSIETFGTVDGPGIRLVVFLQGCPLRCLFCHNPDTWVYGGGEEITPEEIIEEYEKNKAFYSKGGITVTGGEPLMQIEFVTELFTLAKARGIHTCIDTSGSTFCPESSEGTRRLDKLLELTDLVMLDIKHIDTDHHKKLTGRGNEAILAFALHLGEKNVPIWVRHVLIRGYTDDTEHLRSLGRFIATVSSVKALDVIPYHTMGIPKYESLGIDYPLKGVPPTEADEVVRAKAFILDGYKEAKRALR